MMLADEKVERSSRFENIMEVEDIRSPEYTEGNSPYKF